MPRATAREMLPTPIDLPAVRRDPGRVVFSTQAASLLDLGDGALCLEFHSKGNTLEAGTLQALERALEIVSTRYCGLLIANQGAHFSFGADLRWLLASLERFGDDHAGFMRHAKRVQRLVTGVRHTPFAVVAAPFGLTVGGGLELSMYADGVQACADLQATLPEILVGILPDLGGTSELYVRSLDAFGEPAAALRRAFETIVFARRSTDAAHARRLGFLRPGDGITQRRSDLLADAKARLLELAGGYRPPAPRAQIAVLGDAGYAALENAVEEAVRSGNASPYDAIVARAVARVLTGGPGPARELSAAELLDLETHYFESLVFNPQTQARMRHLLETGKALRN